VPEASYTRRVCAVLLADVSGYSALVGEDDEGAARAVDSLKVLVQSIIADHSGSGVSVAGDAFFATFDSVVAAVSAAIEIQRRIAAQEFAGRRLRIRIGVHYGDLLLREGATLGDAINVAARLESIARPGTICISDGVYRHVRRRFDEAFEDLGLQRLKNISEPVHAYLIVPRGHEETERPRQRPLGAWAAGAGLLAVVVVAAGLGWRHWTRPGTTPRPPSPRAAGTIPAGAAPADSHATDQVTLGVMLFKPLGAEEETAWMREALRDGLNTQLSELKHVKVYSKEFIDFLTTREGLTEIEAAKKLGIAKMLSGSFVAVEDRLQIEIHVVDVPSGVLESSVTTTGRPRDFLELQARMVMNVIDRLALPISAEERAMLLAKRSTDAEALRLLLEAEGQGAVRPPRPDSGLLRWLASRRFPASALAEQPPDATRKEILAVLERYRRATEAREIRALAGIYEEFTPEQQAAQQRYFDGVRDLRIALDNIDVAVVGDEAVVSYTRTDEFADARTGKPMRVSVRLTKVLHRADGSWKLAGGK
jgi:class 3 adenylate cyclase/TolB-like protein